MAHQELDANPLLRLLLFDHAQQSRAVVAYFARLRNDVTLMLAPSTLSEVLFVLEGLRLKIPREDIIRALDVLLRLPLVIRDRDGVERARDLYSTIPSAGWSDCLIAAYSIERGDSDVLSFDRGFDRIPGLVRTEPY